MKKKHRDIVVDGVTYGWIARPSYVTVYKDKTKWFVIELDEEVTPKIVATSIKNKLEEK